MKVILNDDVAHLGEKGDEKNVANGYARNYLFPRSLAVPYNEQSVKYFESIKEEIAARKEAKRKAAASLKDKLEALVVELSMPAGANGRLYGAVTAQTVADFLGKNGFEIERKRIDIPGISIKSVGNYHATIHLYETQVAEVKIAVKAQSDESAKAAAEAEKPAEEASEPAPEAEKPAE